MFMSGTLKPQWLAPSLDRAYSSPSTLDFPPPLLDIHTIIDHIAGLTCRSARSAVLVTTYWSSLHDEARKCSPWITTQTHVPNLQCHALWLADRTSTTQKWTFISRAFSRTHLP